MPQRQGQGSVRKLGILFLLTLCSCSSKSYVDSADLETNALLRRRTREILDAHERTVVHPKPLAEETVEAAEAASKEGPPLILALDDALLLAIESNRDYQARKEDLYLQGLSLTLTRFNFGPQVNATVDYLYGRTEGGPDGHAAGTNFNLSQILPTGGTLSFTSSIGGAWTSDGSDSYAMSTRVNLSQPLLRGAGHAISHEALTQAERSLVYAVRSFELFRQDFAISVARQFYDLVGEKRTLANVEQDYLQAKHDRNQAEALRKVDRNTDQEVFRARRREIEAEDRHIQARADYERSLDDFNIVLGMPTSRTIVIKDADPAYEQTNVDPVTAVAAAKHNRLDIQTARDRLDDVERGVNIAENALLPDFNLNVGAGLAGDDLRLHRALPDDWSVSAGISLEIPLQRKAQRNAYRSALIGFAQARRDLSLIIDNLELSIQDQIRQLKRLEAQVALQRSQIKDEERAVAVTEIRYESGVLDNRDLLEARQALFTAKNALIGLTVDHFIQRLQLLRSLGLLFIDDKGMWR